MPGRGEDNANVLPPHKAAFPTRAAHGAVSDKFQVGYLGDGRPSSNQSWPALHVATGNAMAMWGLVHISIPASFHAPGILRFFTIAKHSAGSSQLWGIAYHPGNPTGTDESWHRVPRRCHMGRRGVY